MDNIPKTFYRVNTKGLILDETGKNLQLL